MSSNGRKTVLFAGSLIDGTGKAPVDDAAIVIERGRIVQLGSRREVDYDARDVEVVDASGSLVMPGLVDSHNHLFYLDHSHFKEPSVVIAVARGIRNAGLWLDLGITTTRDMSTRENLDIGLRDAINAGLVRGPRLFVSGMGLITTCGKDEAQREIAIEITGEVEARRVTRQQLYARVDFSKLFTTAGLANNGIVLMTFDEIKAAVEEAHKAGKKVAAHAMATEGIKNAVRAGVDTIEHGTFLDEEAVEMMKSRSVALVTTLSRKMAIAELGEGVGRTPTMVENARRSLEPAVRSIQLARQAGVRIAAGTDGEAQDTLAREVAALVRAGLSNMEALVAATRSGAEILGMSSEFGTLEVGKRADILVLGDNPLNDITALERVRYVLKDGEIVRRPQQTK